MLELKKFLTRYPIIGYLIVPIILGGFIGYLGSAAIGLISLFFTIPFSAWFGWTYSQWLFKDEE